MANSWFKPQGSKRDGMRIMSHPAMIRWATGIEKPTQPLHQGGSAASDMARTQVFLKLCPQP